MFNMNEPAAPITIALRIPGKWSHPRELIQRLPAGCRLTGEELILPDATQVGFGAMAADDQFAQIFRSSCRQPATADELATVDGVAQAEVLGGQTFAMRVWLDPLKMAARGVTADDLANAIRTNNFQSAPGQAKGYFTVTNVTADTGLTSLDQFRGTPYIQMDLRVSRPIKFGDRWQVLPFAEFFNLFNRNNPGANYVGNVSLLPLPQSDVASGNATNICRDFPTCAQLQPITSLKQLEIPAGALGDFFGPGTTVGIPFAAQLGMRVNF